MKIKLLQIFMVMVNLLPFTISRKKNGGGAEFFSNENGRPYLVIDALGVGGQLLSKIMTISNIDTILGRTVYCGQLSGKNIVLAESGVGLTNTAMNTQKMIDIYNPGAVLLTGIAGAIDTSVHIGDIIICDKWADHDFGYIGPDGFTVVEGIDVVPYGSNKIVNIKYFETNKTMIKIAKEIEELMPELNTVCDNIPQIIVGGNGVSGNQFVDQDKKRLWISENYNALIADMETTAVAQVCVVNGLPFISIRSASDIVGGSGLSTAEEEMDMFFRVAAENSTKILIQFLNKI